VKRELLIAVGAATVVAGSMSLAGCSGDNKASGPSSSAASSSNAASSSISAPVAATAAPAAAGQPQVTVGGQPQSVGGPVVCSMTNGKFSIAIGDMFTGVIVGLEQDGSAVHNAGLGTVNGAVPSFAGGAPGNGATAVKTGSSYKITVTASGGDNSGQQVSKDFAIDVTCPPA
jgi:lipoprotein LpqH